MSTTDEEVHIRNEVKRILWKRLIMMVKKFTERVD